MSTESILIEEENLLRGTLSSRHIEDDNYSEALDGTKKRKTSKIRRLISNSDEESDHQAKKPRLSSDFFDRTEQPLNVVDNRDLYSPSTSTSKVLATNNEKCLQTDVMKAVMEYSTNLNLGELNGFIRKIRDAIWHHFR